MRLPSYHLRRSLDVEMTSMIDVVFLLLVFFVWTASFQIVEQLLPSEMSSAEGTSRGAVEQPTPNIDFDLIVVKMTFDNAQPSWFVNDQPLASWSALSDKLSSIATIKSDVPVVVDPSATVPLGNVIDVYDLARKAGFGSVRFAVEP